MRAQHRYRALGYLVLPPLAALVALASGWGLGRLAQHHLDLTLGGTPSSSAGTCWFHCAGCSASLRPGDFSGAVELPDRLWRHLDRLAGIVVASLAVGTAALVAYLIALAGLDSSLLSAHEGLFATPLLPTLLVIVAGGIVACGLAIAASRQAKTIADSSR